MASSWTVKRKLTVGFAAMLVVLLATSAAMYMIVRELADEAADMARRRTAVLQASNDLNISLLQTARHTYNVLLLDDSRIGPELEGLRREAAEREALLRSLEAGIRSPQGRALLPKLKELAQNYAAPEAEFIRLAQSGDRARAREQLFSVARPAQLAYIAGTEEMSKLQHELIARAREELTGTAVSAKVMLLVLDLIGLVVALGLGVSPSKMSNGAPEKFERRPPASVRIKLPAATSQGD